MAFELRVPRQGWSMEEGTFIAWLRADGETPRRFDAFVKLLSSATATNAAKTPNSSRTIPEWYSQTLCDFSA